MKRSWLIAGAMFGLLSLPASALAQGIGGPSITPPIQTTTQTTVQLVAPPPDPKVTAQNAVEGSQAILFGVILPPPLQWANDVLTGIPDIFRQTPRQWTIDNPDVQSVANIVHTAALVLTGLAILALGIQWGLHQTEGRGGRILLALVLVIGEQVFWSIGIDLNNNINNAIAAPDLPGIVQPHINMSVLPTDPASFTVQAIAGALLAVIYAIALLLLVFTMISRLAIIDVLIAIGPIALICCATEQTEGIFSRYTAVSVGLLFSQVAFVVGLKLVGTLFGLASGPAGALLGIFILLALKSLPGLFMQLPRTEGRNGFLGGMGLGFLFKKFLVRA